MLRPRGGDIEWTVMADPEGNEFCAFTELATANLEQVSRRDQILSTAAALFAERGFHGVSVADLGAACGISGPALYRHFPSKDAMLAEMLASISNELLAVGPGARCRGRDRRRGAGRSRRLARRLRPGEPGAHRRPGPGLGLAARAAREQVRLTQNAYVGVWVGVLQRRDPRLAAPRARAMAQAAFGLLNSTPRTGRLPAQELRELLSAMALAALGACPRGCGLLTWPLGLAPCRG